MSGTWMTRNSSVWVSARKNTGSDASRPQLADKLKLVWAALVFWKE